MAAERKCRKFFLGFKYDAELKTAITTARASMEHFVKALQKPKKQQEHFSVNLLIVKQREMEMVWLEMVRFRNGVVFGIPCRDSILNKRIKQGIEMVVDNADVCDWMYVDNGKLVGGATVKQVVGCLSDAGLLEFEILAPFVILDKSESELPINLLLNCIGYHDGSAVLKQLKKDPHLANKVGVVGRYYGSAGAEKVSLTPLNYCADVGDFKTIVALLKAGADPNWKDYVDGTALMAAAGNGDSRKIRVLIEHNAQVNAANALGFTALFFAAETGRADCVEILLMNGSDVERITDSGEGVLHYARSPAVVDLLLKAGAQIDRKEKVLKQSALGSAIERGNVEVAVELVQAGCKIEKADLKVAREHFTEVEWHLFQSAISKAN